MHDTFQMALGNICAKVYFNTPYFKNLKKLNKRRDIKRFMKTGGIFEQNFGIGRSFDSPLSKDIGGLQRNDKLSIILFLHVDIELHEKNFTVLISKSLLLRLRIGTDIGVYTSHTQDSNFGDGKKKVYHLEI
uniref:Uncharacterized protein n=1 Tax=Glossina palpalis gambiensis TaxID=67801 RepID=A0A1B0BG55_9MUSC